MGAVSDFAVLTGRVEAHFLEIDDLGGEGLAVEGAGSGSVGDSGVGLPGGLGDDCEDKGGDGDFGLHHLGLSGGRGGN